MAKKEPIKVVAAKAADDQPPKMVKILVPKRESGWFSFVEVEIEERILAVHGNIRMKSEPDIFAIFKDQVIVKLREIFEI